MESIRDWVKGFFDRGWKHNFQVQLFLKTPGWWRNLLILWMPLEIPSDSGKEGKIGWKIKIPDWQCNNPICCLYNIYTRWWFQIFCMFNPNIMMQFDEHIFQVGCFNHQVGKNGMWVCLDHCESQMAWCFFQENVKKEELVRHSVLRMTLI